MVSLRAVRYLAFFILTLTASALAAPQIHVPHVHRSVLPTGLTVLVAENHEVPLVSLHVLVRAGSMDDPAGKEGLADLTATLLRRGAGARDAEAFARAVDGVGGTLSTGSGIESSLVQAEFQAGDLEYGLSLLGSLLVQPRFDPDEVTRSIRQAVSARRQALDDPGRLADDQMQTELFRDHPYGHPTEGFAKALETITRADVMEFYARHWNAANAVIAVVGDVEASEVETMVQRAMGEWKAGRANAERVPLPSPVRGRRVVLVQKPAATQAQIRLCQVGIDRKSPDYFAVMVANTVLGGGFTSWLVDEIRVNRGLSYGASSRFYPFLIGGYFRISTFTKNATVKETIEVALAQVERLRAGRLDSATLVKAKNYITGLYPLRLETSDALADALLQLEYYGQPQSWIEDYARRIEEVSLEDLKSVARAHFAYDDLLFVVVGDRAQIESQLEVFGPVTVIDPE